MGGSAVIIGLDTIRDYFQTAAAQGVELKRPMLWGYFFVARDDEAAQAGEQLDATLQAKGYAFVESFGGDDDAVWLHFEKAEQLSAEQLAAICAEMHELGETHGLEFDGFDMGNVDGSVLRPA